MRGAITVVLTMVICCASVLGKNITLDEFVQLALKNHPHFERQDLRVEIDERWARYHLGRGEWRLGSGFDYNHSDYDSGYDYTYQRDSYSATTNLNKRLWSTGGTFSVSGATGFSRRVDDWDDESYNHSYNLLYRQPLLRDFLGKEGNTARDISAINIERAKASAQECKEDYLLHLEDQFVYWAYYCEQEKIYQNYFVMRKSEYEKIKKKQSAGKADKLDLIRAADALASVERESHSARIRSKTRGVELSVLVGEESLSEWTPEYDIYQRYKLPNMKDSLARMKKTSVQLKIYLTRKKELQRVLDGSKNAKLPRLDLSLSGNISASGDEQRYLWEGDQRRSYGAGIYFSYPFGNRQRDSLMRISELQLEEIEADIRRTEIELESKLRSYLTELSETRELLRLSKERVESSKRKAAQEAADYARGDNELAFVIAAQGQVFGARLVYASDAMRYQWVMLQYQDLMDSLLPEEERNTQASAKK